MYYLKLIFALAQCIFSSTSYIPITEHRKIHIKIQEHYIYDDGQVQVKKTILLTNDDGIHAGGLQVLRNAVDSAWDTVMVAPESEQSASSHSLTLNRPLRVRRIDEKTIAVDGTPADCVMLSVEGLLEKKPDLVVSGINSGANLGDDVIYSGTVAGAAEAAIMGIPSVAFSFTEPDTTDYEEGARTALKIIEALARNKLPEGVFLNVNFPGRFTGGRFEITHLGRRYYREMIVEKIDPRGKPYYWIGGQVSEWRGGERCDFAAIERGNVSITPLQLDMTARKSLEEISSWFV